MNNNSFRVAFCGLITAFALALMFATGLIPVGTYAFPCFAGMLLVAVVIEFGARWALAAFAAVSLLSFFLSGDKEAVVYFIAFFGFYPILKSAIERLKSKVLQYVIKYAVFTACIVAAFFVCKFVLMIPDEEFTLFGVYLPWVFLAGAEAFFFLYDLCVSLVVRDYVLKIRGKIFKGKNNF